MSSQHETDTDADTETDADATDTETNTGEATTMNSGIDCQVNTDDIYGTSAPRRIPLADPPEIDPSVNLNYDPAFHDFLFLADGSLPNGGQYGQIEAVRNHIDTMYPTDAVFSLKQVDGVEPAKSQFLTDDFMEFAGAWIYHPYGNTRTQPVRRFVRANASDAVSRGGFSVPCQQCERDLTIEAYLRDTLDSAHDDCDAVSRMESKQRLANKAEREMRRLYWRGWRKQQVRNRFGLEYPHPNHPATPQDTITAFALRQQLGVDANAMREMHRYATANTILYLHVHHDMSVREICPVYGISHETAYMWIRDYTAIETVRHIDCQNVIVPHPPSARS